MSLDSAEVEALPGFAEEDSIYIKAVMNDRSGNENNDEITKDGFAKWTSLIQKRKISIK